MKRVLSTALATVLVGTVGFVVAPAAQAITGPGWRQVQCAPISACPQVRAEYSAKGYLTTAIRPSSWNAGVGLFEYHR